jgi:hypothetical protein
LRPPARSQWRADRSPLQQAAPLGHSLRVDLHGGSYLPVTLAGGLRYERTGCARACATGSLQSSCGAQTSSGAGPEEGARRPGQTNEPLKTKDRRGALSSVEPVLYVSAVLLSASPGALPLPHGMSRRRKTQPGTAVLKEILTSPKNTPPNSSDRGRQCAYSREPTARLGSNECLRFRQRICSRRQ